MKVYHRSSPVITFRSISPRPAPSVGIHPDLLSCMNNVYLRGCEAAYLGAMVKTSEFCAAGETSFTSPPGVNAAQFVHDVNDHHVENDQESKSVGGSSSVGGHSQERGPGAGSLAIHIRSGDIFEGRLDSRRYGQVGCITCPSERLFFEKGRMVLGANVYYADRFCFSAAGLVL